MSSILKYDCFELSNFRGKRSEECSKLVEVQNKKSSVVDFKY